MANKQVYEKVMGKVIAAMEAGEIPWQKGWATNRPPHNALSGRSYHGGNVLALWFERMLKEYTLDAWVTFKQALEAGCVVQKGQHATPVYFMKSVTRKAAGEDAEGDSESLWIARLYFVFNVDQLTDLEAAPGSLAKLKARFNDMEERNHKPLTKAERVAKESGAVIVHRNPDRCFYAPMTDEVNMPPLSRFKTRDGYYASLFHELGHWTGHESRLNRDMKKGMFSKPDYAFEELIAELSAAFSAHRVGIPHVTQAAAYLQSWLKAIKDKPNALASAATHAMKATAFVFKDPAEEAIQPQEKEAA